MYDLDAPEKWLAIVALGALVLYRLYRALRRRRGGGALHARNKRASGERISRISETSLSDSPARAFAYLRKVDPFIFEEMILTAFETRGVKVIRNKRYTGDGGIDGRVVLNGAIVLIQAKRYSSHIDAAHVADFARMCDAEGCDGLFIHTGKTGKQARTNARNAQRIEIISGGRLLSLLQGGSVRLLGHTLPQSDADNPRKRGF